jgi:Kae1-associated kinase Bud32
MLIRIGAEAEIHLVNRFGRKVIAKRRVPKTYRTNALDNALRAKRTRGEALLISRARALGIPTPIIYDIDVDKGEIVMEYIAGKRVKDILKNMPSEARAQLCRHIGVLIGKLHKNDFIHGDLTTSNLILHEDKIYFIDFGLGEINREIEAKGVDLHVLMEAFESTHSELLDYLEHILEGYRSEYEKAAEVEQKIQEIIKRGRYL